MEPDEMIFLGVLKWLGVVGTSIAVMISWTSNQSVLWATIHGFLNWFYVGYYLVFEYVL